MDEKWKQSRRSFLKAGLASVLAPGLGRAAETPSRAAEQRSRPAQGVLVNDIHSQLNETRVDHVVQPVSQEGLQAVVRRARANGMAVSISGGRHAMGGQQFGRDTVLVDTSRMRRVVGLDADEGIVEVEGGIQWPELVTWLHDAQAGQARPWGIVQKQTGADRLSIGGALSANVHGRGLTYRPIVQDVESFTLVDADGELRRCSRTESSELFRLAIGGYGLFGPIGTVRLRLGPRQKIERVVEVIEIDDLMPAFEARIADGFLFGDFQYATAEDSDIFMRRGVFSCYRPVDPETPIPEGQAQLSVDDWKELTYLSHADKQRAFDVYSGYYLGTSGQIYWSDTHQMSTYFDDYHTELSKRLGENRKATEMISELYVPRTRLADFMADTAGDFRRNAVDCTYGTIRLIERDTETFLAWAREPWACIIFNVHVVHTDEGIAQAAAAFQRLIDRARRHGGSYYLTYHRWARRDQVEGCYPQIVDFLRHKRRHDPDERFQSDWYRHYREMFRTGL